MLELGARLKVLSSGGTRMLGSGALNALTLSRPRTHCGLAPNMLVLWAPNVSQAGPRGTHTLGPKVLVGWVLEALAGWVPKALASVCWPSERAPLGPSLQALSSSVCERLWAQPVARSGLRARARLGPAGNTFRAQRVRARSDPARNTFRAQRVRAPKPSASYLHYTPPSHIWK